MQIEQLLAQRALGDILKKPAQYQQADDQQSNGPVQDNGKIVVSGHG